MMRSVIADLMLILHFLWAAWMVFGIFLAVAGFRWRGLWSWKIFRISHLIGILITSTVPFWAGGICPLTEWEWQLRNAGGNDLSQGAESFIIHWMREILFFDLNPVYLSLAAGLGALVTILIFFRHPPWRS
jgi:hypothetical protein